jgi:hypothetical protein
MNGVPPSRVDVVVDDDDDVYFKQEVPSQKQLSAQSPKHRSPATKAPEISSA